MKTITILLISILFTKELIVINQDFVIYTTFIILLLISIKAFAFLTNSFDYIRMVEKNQINLSSLNEQILYHSQLARSIAGLDSPHLCLPDQNREFQCGRFINLPWTHPYFAD